MHIIPSLFMAFVCGLCIGLPCGVIIALLTEEKRVR